MTDNAITFKLSMNVKEAKMQLQSYIDSLKQTIGKELQPVGLGVQGLVDTKKYARELNIMSQSLTGLEDVLREASKLSKGRSYNSEAVAKVLSDANENIMNFLSAHDTISKKGGALVRDILSKNKLTIGTIGQDPNIANLSRVISTVIEAPFADINKIGKTLGSITDKTVHDIIKKFQYITQED